jgi:hypothetical protein
VSACGIARGPLALVRASEVGRLAVIVRVPFSAIPVVTSELARPRSSVVAVAVDPPPTNVPGPLSVKVTVTPETRLPSRSVTTAVTRWTVPRSVRGLLGPRVDVPGSRPPQVLVTVSVLSSFSGALTASSLSPVAGTTPYSRPCPRARAF